MSTLPKKVIHYIRKHRMWSAGERITVAVSGGLDSICLLDLLCRTREAHGAFLQVVSLDHGLREGASDEVSFVAERAKSYGVPFHSACLGLEAGPNLQARARDERQAALLSVPCFRIATAHHLNDQAETILYRLLRGSGATGLRGMLPVSHPWCRPLLFLSRRELLLWAEEQKLEWKEDPSNAASLRGRLRSIMPLLDELHGDSAHALARSGRLLARDDEFLQSAADSCWNRLWNEEGLELRGLLEQPEPVQVRLLRMLLRKEGVPVRSERLEAYLLWRPRENSRLSLAGGRALGVRNGYILVE